ncbi:MATE family efflux transporter [Roseicyclus mahoneyensis]|uniref:Multidrug-efflux transporter n=1 Tax=Roseicyclus mahoneyensis TaxID=164332 RepID=A0A316GRJ2_9RHOB|nr:MATE family efflux transporter [Roseicyclus mahoneyensis]PWK62652.1 MATE family multidrug resistance protein [Roseicyclus mahoneyensis]
MTSLSAHLRATLSLGLPLIGGMLAQIAITVTDTVMMGWYGVPELAAVALGGSYFHVVLILGMGFGLAVMPMVAAAAANDDRRQVRRITRMGLWIALIFSALVMPLFVFSGTILRTLGQSEEIATMGEIYLRIAGWGIAPAVVMTVLRSHLSALDHARVVLYAVLAGACLNAGLNWLLIFGNLGAPELGIAGAAYASIGTQALIALVLALHAGLHRDLKQDTLFARFWRPDWEAFAQVFRLGWPIALTLLSESGLFMATMVMMGWLGPNPLAAHGIALQICSVTFMVHIGLSQAATVRAGRAWGTGDVENLRLAAIAALILSGAMVALTILGFVLIPEALIGLFLDPGDPLRPEILALGASLLIVAALFQLADAGQVMALGLLRGTQDTRVPMIYALISYWLLGLPAAWVIGFPLGFEGPGIWWGLVVGLAFAAGLMMTRFWRGPARRPVGAAPA